MIYSIIKFLAQAFGLVAKIRIPTTRRPGRSSNQPNPHPNPMTTKPTSKAQSSPIQDIEEFESKIEIFGVWRKQLDANREAMEIKIDQLRAQQADDDRVLKESIERLGENLREFAEQNRVAIYGKTQSQKSATCIHGFKKSTRLITTGIATETTVLEALQNDEEDLYLNVKISLDKPALKAAPKEFRERYSLALKTDEKFYVKPRQ